MSTKEVQKKWGKEKLTTSEGVVRMRTVKYTLEGWTENFGPTEGYNNKSNDGWIKRL